MTVVAQKLPRRSQSGMSALPPISDMALHRSEQTFEALRATVSGRGSINVRGMVMRPALTSFQIPATLSIILNFIKHFSAWRDIFGRSGRPAKGSTAIGNIAISATTYSDRTL